MKKFKDNYPVLKQCVYLDTAATMQKHISVIDAVSSFSKQAYANIHRGVYPLSIAATSAFEATRKTVAELLSADTSEIIFTKSATEGLNLLANSVLPLLKGKEIVLSISEHHANFVPWQKLASTNGFSLKIIPVKDDLSIDYDKAASLITKDTALIAITHMSNVTGHITDISFFRDISKEHDSLLILDASQSIAHTKVSADMADFIVFSSHKIGGPSGVGILYGSKNYLTKMAPYQVGGDMVLSVSINETLFQETPYKFEAGTQNIEGVVGLGKAINLMQSLSYEKIQEHDNDLTKYAIEKLSSFENVTVYGGHNGIVSFTVKGIHAHDVAQLFADKGVCVRGGHMCSMPLLNELLVPAVVRMSFWYYTTKDDIDKAIVALQHAIKVFS